MILTLSENGRNSAELLKFDIVADDVNFYVEVR